MISLLSALLLTATPTIVANSNTTPVLIDATISSTSTLQISNISTGEVDLIYNIANAPAGGSSMTVSLSGSDPLNPGTTITSDCSVTSAAITGAVSGLITCSPIRASAVLVTWTVSSGSFSGVYLTLVMKPLVSSGISDGGVINGNIYMQGILTLDGGADFLPVTLGTCSATIEGMVETDATSGVSTGHPTRLCYCRSDGSGNYQWRNLLDSAQTGTSTTCPD